MRRVQIDKVIVEPGVRLVQAENLAKIATGTLKATSESKV